QQRKILAYDFFRILRRPLIGRFRPDQYRCECSQVNSAKVSKYVVRRRNAIMAKKTQISVSNDAADYRDVVVRINLDGKTDWLFTVSLDKEFDLVLEDASPRSSATDAEDFIENDRVPPDVLVELERVQPEVMALLQPET
ncbi:MAG: hypothetical protein J0651_03980, partial [Actinobacteria bacterium]|nr:hypothetical protein [Actinomycetota bacterium]